MITPRTNKNSSYCDFRTYNVTVCVKTEGEDGDQCSSSWEHDWRCGRW